MSNFSHQPSPMTFEYKPSSSSSSLSSSLQQGKVRCWHHLLFVDDDPQNLNYPKITQIFFPLLPREPATGKVTPIVGQCTSMAGQEINFSRESLLMCLRNLGPAGCFFFSEKSTEDWWFAVVGGSISNNPFHIEVRIVNCQHWQKICGWLVAM